MERVHNWDVWLVRLAQAAEGQDFEWGRTDCVSLVRRALTQMLGEDPWRRALGTWTTKVGAIRVFKRTRPQIVLRATGATRVGTLFATTGDVALGRGGDHDGMLQLGMVLPSRKILTSTLDQGVFIVGGERFSPDVRFFRYG